MVSMQLFGSTAIVLFILLKREMQALRAEVPFFETLRRPTTSNTRHQTYITARLESVTTSSEIHGLSGPFLGFEQDASPIREVSVIR